MSLTAMLTPYLVNQLGSGDVAQVTMCSTNLTVEIILFLYTTVKFHLMKFHCYA